MSRRGLLSRHRAVLVVLAVALLFRVVVVLASPHWAPNDDSADYDRIAVSLAQTGSYGIGDYQLTGVVGPSAFRAPLFPFALAAVYKVVGVGSTADRWEAGRIEEALLGVLAVWLIWLIVRRIWGERIAFWAGLVAALYPPLVLAGSSLMSESLFIPLVLAAVYAALRCRDEAVVRSRIGWAVAAGVLIGAAALTRTTGLILVLPLALMVRRGRWPAVAMVAALLITLIPWTVRNYATFHSIIPITTEGGYALAGVYTPASQDHSSQPAIWLPPVADFTQVERAHPHYDEAQYASSLGSLALKYIRAHPLSVLKTSYWNLLRMLDFDGVRTERLGGLADGYPAWLTVISVLSFWVAGLIALAGLALKEVRSLIARGGVWFWAAPVVMFLICLPIAGTTRYRLPSDPWLPILDVLVISSIAYRMRRISQ